MAYGKRKIYRRRPLRRPRRAGSSWYNKKYSAMDAGRMALSQIWKLKGLVNSELFKLDSSGGFSVTDSGAQIQPLVAVAQGDGDGQRTGNSLFVRSFNAKNYVTWNPSGDAVQTVMICLVQDTQQIGDNSPGFTDIFTSNSVVSHLNPATVGRFKLLYRQTCHLDVNHPRVNVNINKAMRHHVRYNGTASTDIQRGGLYLVWISTQATANYPTATYNHRVSYHDN